MDHALGAAVAASFASKAGNKIARRIVLVTPSERQGLAKLKEAGFIAQSGVVGGFITGECDAARLSDLAKLSVVRYISKP